MNYRNTPDCDSGKSPAPIVFGRALKDAIPVDIEKLKPSVEWMLSMDDREQALQGRQQKMGLKWSEHTKELQQLEVGCRVWVQNQTGVRQKNGIRLEWYEKC